MVDRKFINELERLKLREGRDTMPRFEAFHALAYRVFAGKASDIRTWMTEMIENGILRVTEDGSLILPEKGEIIERMKTVQSSSSLMVHRSSSFSASSYSAGVTAKP
jgi:hypothetical protein